MRTISLVMCILVGVQFCWEPVQGQANQVELIDRINTFSIKFYKQTSNAFPGQNLIISPLSANIVLALLSLGAKTQTQNQLFTALDLNDENSIKTQYQTFIQNLLSVKSIILNMVNKIYVKLGPDYALDTNYQSVAKSVFSSLVQNIDFTNPSPAAVASQINSWVAAETSNTITNLIKPTMLTPNTMNVLINAIYFEAKWEKEFDVKKTATKAFIISNTQAIPVQMMSQNNLYPFANIPQWNAQILELPYVGSEASMLFILPNDKFGLSALESKIFTTSNLKAIFSQLVLSPVDVQIPKFTIDTYVYLNQILKNLGITRMFRAGRADLTGMLQKPTKGLYVSDTLQKAFIELNEVGTKAGAATVAATSIKKQGTPFIADHPFVYMIRSKNGEILFIGRFTGRVSKGQQPTPEGPADVSREIRARRVRGVIAGYDVASLDD